MWGGKNAQTAEFQITVVQKYQGGQYTGVLFNIAGGLFASQFRVFQELKNFHLSEHNH